MSTGPELHCMNTGGCTGTCSFSVTTIGIAAQRLIAITPQLQHLPCDVRINGRSVRTMRR